MLTVEFLFFLLSLPVLIWGWLFTYAVWRRDRLKWLAAVQLANAVIFETIWALGFLGIIVFGMRFLYFCMFAVAAVCVLGLLAEGIWLLLKWREVPKELYLSALGASVFQLIACFGVFVIVEAWASC